LKDRDAMLASLFENHNQKNEKQLVNGKWLNGLPLNPNP
jgi:hypothetical protein